MFVLRADDVETLTLTTSGLGTYQSVSLLKVSKAHTRPINEGDLRTG